MGDDKQKVRILVADDDEDDRVLAMAAFEESNLINPIDFVEDGEQVLAYLRREGQFADLKQQPLPGLILLDLNMPRMDGREVLEELKDDPLLKHIPVVVLTTSQQEDDIVNSYALGANSFITKPVTFDGLVTVMRTLKMYWLEIVKLPGNKRVDE